MSAAEALTQARAAGIQVGVDGEALVLETSGQPPAEVLNLLAPHKADILTLLRRGYDGWSGEDWRVLFDEIAGIAELDGGLRRDRAEARALFCSLSALLHCSPTRSPAGRCDHCGQSNGLLVPYLTGCSMKDPANTWLHQECSMARHLANRAKAVTALVAMGLSVPVKFSDDFGKNGSA